MINNKLKFGSLIRTKTDHYSILWSLINDCRISNQQQQIITQNDILFVYKSFYADGLIHTIVLTPLGFNCKIIYYHHSDIIEISI